MPEVPQNVTDFHLLRAECIDKYAHLELVVGNIFSWLMDGHPVKSQIVFSRIANTRSRNLIVQELLVFVFGRDIKKFSDTLFRQIGNIDSTRNNIVHWQLFYETANGRGSGIPTNGEPFKPILTHPNLANPSKLSSDDLVDFLDRLHFVTQVTTMLQVAVDSRIQGKEENIEQWRAFGMRPLHEIYPLRVEYPPPKNHPLSRFARERENPPQSSHP